MIAQLLVVTLPAFALGVLLIALGSRKASAGARRERWLKLAAFFAIVHGVLLAAAAGSAWLVALMVAIVLVGAGELASAWRRMEAPRPRRIWLVYSLVAALAIANAFALAAPVLAFLFVVAASFDGFSQAIGQWLGRTPLAPRVSPAKTIEGAFGGLAGATLVAMALHEVADASVSIAALWGAATSAAALAGDLAKSWVKRRAGIKDFAATLPGHGGFLDRFDSFLAASGLVGLAMRFGLTS